MNICFLEGDMSRCGGTERMTAVLANEFSKTHKVWILSLQMKNNRIFFPLNNNVKHQYVQASGKLRFIKQIYALRNFLRVHQIDWLINVDIGTSIYGIPAAIGIKSKVVTWEHGNFYNNWGSRCFPYFRRFAAKHSDAMVVLTEKDRMNYQNNIPSKKPVFVIHNPVERHDFHYDTESKTILSAGLLLPIKRYDRAIQAAAQVLPRYPRWKWIICGEGPERTHLEKLITENGLKKQVQLLGTVSDMDEQYQNAAMFVMTSEMEGLPMVLLEAKSWGLPLVSFDIMTGPSDIIRDGVNGYLVKPYDVKTLSERIEELILFEEKRVEFSANSQLDMERVSYKRIFRQWYELMED